MTSDHLRSEGILVFDCYSLLLAVFLGRFQWVKLGSWGMGACVNSIQHTFKHHLVAPEKASVQSESDNVGKTR